MVWAHEAIDLNDLEAALRLVPDACDIVQQVARAAFEEAPGDDRPFEVLKFFKDASTKTLIQAAVPEFLRSREQLNLSFDPGATS
jgi:hypothetical protein